jgi:curli biogenesis system outer membrane secretion channel CsgG
VEREKLKALEDEQDFGKTNRVKRGTGPKIGGITGADAMLLGDIVIFGRDDKAKRNGAGTLLRWIPLIGPTAGALSDARKTDKAVVAINLRLVDAETSEVLGSDEARGESSRTSTDWGAVAGTWKGAAATSSDMTSSNFQDTIIGEATADAVTKIVAFINQQIPQIEAKVRTVEGKVANFDGCTLYLNVGGNDGVHVGDRFQILQIIGEIVDPGTKQVLDQKTVKVGDLIVSTVRDRVSVGQYGGEALSQTYAKGYAARLVAK